MKKAFVLIFFFTITINAQNTEYSRIDQIDSLVLSIPLTMVKANGYNQIEGSGLIFKNSWMFFKKRIGSFNDMIIYRDDQVFLIQKFTRNKKGTLLENFFYENNSLIKYEREVSNVKNESDIKVYHLYFDNNQIINEVTKDNLDVEALIIKSININKSWLDHIIQSNHYFLKQD